jgi:hypothetical protein
MARFAYLATYQDAAPCRGVLSARGINHAMTKARAATPEAGRHGLEVQLIESSHDESVFFRHGGELPAGWTCDRDLWLVRKLKPGDAPESFWSGALSCHGFHCKGRVYAREISHAVAFDHAGALIMGADLYVLAFGLLAAVACLLVVLGQPMTDGFSRRGRR